MNTITGLYAARAAPRPTHGPVVRKQARPAGSTASHSANPASRTLTDGWVCSASPARAPASANPAELRRRTAASSASIASVVHSGVEAFDHATRLLTTACVKCVAMSSPATLAAAARRPGRASAAPSPNVAATAARPSANVKSRGSATDEPATRNTTARRYGHHGPS